jgi:hypothetical protein
VIWLVITLTATAVVALVLAVRLARDCRRASAVAMGCGHHLYAHRHEVAEGCAGCHDALGAYEQWLETGRWN